MQKQELHILFGSGICSPADADIAPTEEDNPATAVGARDSNHHFGFSYAADYSIGERLVASIAFGSIRFPRVRELSSIRNRKNLSLSRESKQQENWMGCVDGECTLLYGFLNIRYHLFLSVTVLPGGVRKSWEHHLKNQSRASHVKLTPRYAHRYFFVCFRRQRQQAVSHHATTTTTTSTRRFWLNLLSFPLG